MKMRRTKCFKEKETVKKPIRSTFLIQNDVNCSSNENKSVELKPIETYMKELNNANHDTNDRETGNTSHNREASFDSKTLGRINLILKIISGFSESLKSKINPNPTEILIIGDKECKSMFSDILKEEIIRLDPSDNFIYNTKIQGKSGSLVFYTADFKYVIKVIRNSELHVLIKNFNAMRDYHGENPNTYLCKIFGIFSTVNIHFVVMNNILKTPHNQIYDLKGSNVKRNFVGINIESDWKGRRLSVENKDEVLSTIRNDVEFLKSLNLMDYSMLIGVDNDESSGFDLFDINGNVIENLKSTEMNHSLGIVDICTEYTLYKRLEGIFQLIFCCSMNRSSKNPEEYSKRFLDLIENECIEERPDESSQNE